MATRFTDQATKQLNPFYTQQETAVKQQLPAIQQLYDTLLTGLEGQRATETQNILESASSRGVLRSTLPVDLQSQLGAALLGERAKLESQRAGEVANVNKSLSDIGLARAQSISDLANTLQQRDLQERDFVLKKQLADRDYKLSQQKLAAEIAAQKSSSAASSSTPSTAQFLVQAFSGYKPAYQGGQAYYTEREVIPALMANYGLNQKEAANLAYSYRKRVFGEGFGNGK